MKKRAVLPIDPHAAAAPLARAMAVPETAARRLTKGRLILAMGALIAELKSAGLSWAEVSAKLEGAGLKVSPAFLKETVNAEARRGKA